MIGRTDRDGIALLRLQHGKASALDVELCDALVDVFTGLASDGARAVVITGQGRIFSAGVDLHRILAGGAPYVERFLPSMTAAFQAIFRCPKPVVAAVNGHAIAGGCIIAAAADYRLMSGGNERIGIPELLVGVPFPVSVLEIMRFTLPANELQPAVYTGATHLPDEALRRGFVDCVVDPEQLEADALAVATRFAAIAPDLFAATKHDVRGPAMACIDAESPRCDPAVLHAWKSDAVHARIRAYVARTIKRSG
jgi:enoyl-CoA hydratase